MTDTVLEEAAAIIAGARRADYGSPLQSFSAIAAHWTTYLAHRRDPKAPLLPEDVAWMMVLLKQCRYQGGGGQRDSVLDGAGYLGCIESLRAERGDPL